MTILVCGLCGKTDRPFAAQGVVILCYRPDDATINCYTKAVEDGDVLLDGTHWDGSHWVT